MVTAPPTYDEIIALPMTERKQLYLSLPPEVQVGLWLEQVTRYRATHADLTPAQAGVLDDTVALMPRFFSAEHDQVEARMQALSEAAKQEFGIAEAEAIMARLGPP